MNCILEEIDMELKRTGIALSVSTLIAMGAQAQNDVSLNQQSQENPAYWRIGVQGSGDLRQLNSSLNYNNFGVGLQVTDTDNVEQYALTAGLRFTPAQASALSRVLENGQIKVSLVESEVQNAIANFDETGAGFEFIFNLRNAITQRRIVSTQWTNPQNQVS